MRFLSLPLALLLAACATTPTSQTAPESAVVEAERPAAVMNSTVTQASMSLTQAQRFERWKQDFTQRAIAKGYAPALLARTVGQARINERALERDSDQPEFTRPVWAYIKSAASPDRIATGRAELADHTVTFSAVEQVHGVPRHILAAIWGLESSYGRILGTHDIIDSLSTFAFEGRRTQFGEEQLFAALDLIQSGKVREGQLIGSWAGAMGMTQFIPSTFRDYAVDFDRNGNIDLWNNEGDALASAAHYLSRSGWQSGQPVMAEVNVPTGFDYSLSETVRKPVREWTALGIQPANGMMFNRAASELEAKLLVPAGHKGPKLLVFRNFDVLKRYNNSTSYVMGIASLGDALRDRTAITTAWPEGDAPLSFDDKKKMQESLTAQGYDTKGIDGMVGPATRRAIRAWQRDRGLPADGYVEQRLFRQIVG